MNRLFGMLLVGSAMFGVAHQASAQSPWYVTGSAGAYLRSSNGGPQTLYNTNGEIAQGTNTTSYNPGPVVNLGVGYKLPMGFRVEGELGFAYYSTDTINPFTSNTRVFPDLNGSKLTARSGGDHERYSATATIFYDFPLQGQFVPYIGTGFGIVGDNGSTAYFTEAGGSRTFTENSATGVHPAILAEVGLTIALDDKWAIVPAYRFEHVFQTGNAAEENANIFKLGLRYAF